MNDSHTNTANLVFIDFKGAYKKLTPTLKRGQPKEKISLNVPSFMMTQVDKAMGTQYIVKDGVRQDIINFFLYLGLQAYKQSFDTASYEVPYDDTKESYEAARGLF